MSTTIVNATDRLEAARVSWFHWRVFVLCGLAALLDGYDLQAIAFTAPAIAPQFGIPIPAFAPVFAASTAGGALGALVLGPFADKFGRKRILVIATFLFGIFALLTPLVTSLGTLLAARLLTGLGLGAAIPCLIALASEYAPQRVRSFTVTTIWAAFPAGGLLAGLLSAWLIPTLGWQSIFYIGGVLPLAVACAIALWLPESIKFLILKNGDTDAARKILHNVDPDLATVGRYALVSGGDMAPNTGLKGLFKSGYAPITLLFWIAFFMCFGVLAMLLSWAPTLLRGSGISLSAAAFLVALHSLGSIIGMLTIGRIIDRFGPFVVLPVALALGGLSNGALGLAVPSYILITACMSMSGFFLGASSSGIIALCAVSYQTLSRSTGLGWGTGLGRVGQVVGPLTGGALLAADWSSASLFWFMALPPICAGIAVVLLRARLVQRQTPAQAVTA